MTCAAIAAACLAAALPRRELVLLSIFAAARLAIAFFPVTTALHRPFALAAFAAVCAAAVWRGGVPALGYVAIAGAVMTALALRSGGMLGLWERIFYAAVIAWFFVVAARIS